MDCGRCRTGLPQKGLALPPCQVRAGPSAARPTRGLASRRRQNRHACHFFKGMAEMAVPASAILPGTGRTFAVSMRASRFTRIKGWEVTSTKMQSKLRRQMGGPAWCRSCDAQLELLAGWEGTPDSLRSKSRLRSGAGIGCMFYYRGGEVKGVCLGGFWWRVSIRRGI